MKAWTQLSILAFAITPTFCENFVGFFGDGEVISSGIQFLGRSPDSKTDEIQTGTPYELNTWDALTGELVRSARTQFQEEINSSSYLDWEDTNTIAYTDDLETLLLIRRDTSEIVETHTFEGQIITGIATVSGTRILAISTQSKPPDPQTSPPYIQISTASHLVDTSNAEILRSIDSTTREQTHFRGINGGTGILALTRGSSLNWTALNIAESPEILNQPLSRVRILDTDSGIDLITPLQTNSPLNSNGTAFMDEPGNKLYAIMNPGTLHRVDLNNFSVSVFSIENSTSATSLVNSGDTLGALLSNADGFAQRTYVAFWDINDFTQIRKVEELRSTSDPSIHSFLPTPEGSQLILAGQSGEIELWNQSPPHYLLTIGNAMSEIRYWAISPDGRKLLTISANEDSNILHVWDLQNGGLLVKNSNPRGSHVGTAAYFSANSQRIYWYDSEAKLVATRISDGQIDFSIPSGPNSAIACGYFESGSKRMLVHSEGKVQIFDEDDDVSTFDLNMNGVHPHHIDSVNGLLLYQTGSILHSFDPLTNTVKMIWNISDATIPSQAYLNQEASRLILFWNNLDLFDPPFTSQPPPVSQLSEIRVINLVESDELLAMDSISANVVAFSSNKSQFAVGLIEPYSIQFYDTIEVDFLSVIEWPSKIVAMTYSNNDDILFVLSDNRVHLLDLNTKETIYSHFINAKPISPNLKQDRLFVSPNGRLLAVFDSASVRFFQLPEFQEIDYTFRLPALFSTETQFAFSPDGRSFLLVDFLANANEWHLREGVPINGNLSVAKQPHSILSMHRRRESVYSIQLSNDLINWRYSVLKSTRTNSLTGFPLFPKVGSSIFGRIIEFKMPE